MKRLKKRSYTLNLFEGDKCLIGKEQLIEDCIKYGQQKVDSIGQISYIVEKVCKKLKVKKPKVNMFLNRSSLSYGAYYTNTIELYCDRYITVDTILHELAHHVQAKKFKDKGCHNKAFADSLELVVGAYKWDEYY